jgi:hypothetical protein
MNRRFKAPTASLLIVLSFCLFGQAFSASADTEPLKALIVTGQSNHNWRLSTPIVMQILEQTGLFEVDIAISPEEGGNGYDMEKFKPDFGAYDIVVLNYVGDSWSEQTKEAFVEYVKSGGNR